MAKLFAEFDQVEADLEELTKIVGECLEKSLESIVLYLQEGETQEVAKLTDLVHSKESEADEVRRKLVQHILKGSLMPHTRSDMLHLIESIDDIADAAQDILDSIIFLSLKFDHLNLAKLDKMQELLIEQFDKLSQGLKLLFTDMRQSLVFARELEDVESKLDDLEEEITREIGNTAGLEPAAKLAHRDLVKSISDLGDIIENVGDNIETIVSVRKG